MTTELQQELIDFISKCEKNTEARPLKEHLTEELLRQIMHGEREIGDMATNPKTGDVFVRFSFTELVRKGLPKLLEREIEK